MNKTIIIPINIVYGKKAKLLIQQKKALPLARDMAFLNFEIQSINNRSNKEQFVYSVQNRKDWKNPYINNKYMHFVLISRCATNN